MSRRTIRRTTLWMILGLVVLSCGTPVLVTSSPSVSDPASVETVIAQTADAAQTQTMVGLPPTGTATITPLVTSTPTISPTPTATILFLIPTETLLPDDFFEDGDGDGTGDGTGAVFEDDDGEEKILRRQLWACRVLSKRPADESTIVGGTSFKAVWTVENTGTETWPKKSVDIIWAGGARLIEGKPYYDIPAAVSPGGTITLSVTMSVPKRQKDYQTRWALKIGRTQFCSVKFIFSVQ